MIWEVKKKITEDYVYSAFALFPRRCQGRYNKEYWVWLQRYYYCKVPDYEDVERVKFIRQEDCTFFVKKHLDKGGYLY